MYSDAEMHYGVTFGKGDSSDWIEYYADFTPEEQEIYDHCLLMRRNPNEEPGLKAALERAEEDIRETEEDNCVEYDDEYAMECLGRVKMETDTLNDLVHGRDENALEFFHLEDATDEEIDAWDADELSYSEIPEVRDFDPDFEPESPFDNGWILNLEYINPAENENLDDDLAGEILYELMNKADGDYSDVLDFIRENEEYYVGVTSLMEIAKETAEDMDLEDFPGE